MTENNSTLIRHRGLTYDRFDAPFTGVLISAVGCSIGCIGCFNQHLKQLPIITETVDDILDKVQADTFNEGIILGGLEWTEQPAEMMKLIIEAKKRKLQVIVYTGLTEEEFVSKFYVTDVWLKSGGYIDGSNKRQQGSITLASENQQLRYLTDNGCRL